MAEPPFVYHRRVEFADTDMAGIAHFSSLFRYMEEAEHAFLRSVGLSVHSRTDGALISWPRLSASCDFRSPARFEETVAVEVSVHELKAKTVQYRFTMHVADRVVAQGSFVVVCCRLDDDRQLQSIQIPDSIVKRLTSNNAP